MENKSVAAKGGKITKLYAKSKNVGTNKQELNKSKLDSILDELPRVPTINVNFTNPQFLQMQEQDQEQNLNNNLQHFNNILQQPPHIQQQNQIYNNLQQQQQQHFNILQQQQQPPHIQQQNHILNDLQQQQHQHIGDFLHQQRIKKFALCFDVKTKDAWPEPVK